MFQFPGSMLPGAVSIFRFDKIQAARAFMIVALVFLCPGLSLGDVSEPPDTTAEDLGGVALLASNIAVSFYLSHELQAGRPSTARGFLGVGLGTVSVVLGILEETSFSGAVGIAGAVSFTLGLINWVGDGPAQEEKDQDFDLSRAISISPLVLQTEKDQMGLGILMSARF